MNYGGKTFFATKPLTLSFSQIAHFPHFEAHAGNRLIWNYSNQMK